MSWYIYGLRIGTSTEYRYVGLTTQRLSVRLYQHKKMANRYKTPACNWIVKHSDEIVIDVIEECEEGDKAYLAEAEQFWITQIRSFGHRLLNLSEGGASGAYGARWSLRPEQIRKGKCHPNYGRTPSEAERKANGDAHRGIVRSAKSREMQGNTLRAGAHWAYGPKAEAIREKGRANAHRQHHTNKGITRPETCGYCAGTVQ